MSQYATTRPVDLRQLGTELGGEAGPAPLSMVDAGDGNRVLVCHDPSITPARFKAAVDAHVPATPATAPDPADIQAQVDDLADLVLELLAGGPA